MTDTVSFAEELFELLRSQSNAQKHILFAHTIPPHEAVFSPQNNVLEVPFQRLYSHQGDVLEKTSQGKNVAIATATASGKTFATVLPYLVELKNNPTGCLLCIAPTHALAEQWCYCLREWCPDKSVESFTGDTPNDERESIRRNAQIIVTTPDMFHVSLLPYHYGWRSFYQRLRYVIIDESHIYRGVFGSHIAHILHRFRRVMIYHTQKFPIILFATATIGNPKEHTESLLGQSVEAITQSGSPNGGRLFVLWQPRNSSLHSDEATNLMVFFLKQRVRTLLFGQQRQSVERIARNVQNRLPSDLKSKVAAYRSGYHPTHRKTIQEKLVDGQLLGVVSTNALELGIDIGDLAVVIMDGFPGSVASLWQQAGRAGRGKKAAFVLLVLRENALDQYFASYPERLFLAQAEHALINTKNPYILRTHLHCAAKELPLSKQDVLEFGQDAVIYADDLVREGYFIKEGNTYRLKDQKSNPAYHASIRQIGEPLTILDEKERAIEEKIDLPHAVMECYQGAIYLSRGAMYQVERLDLEKKQVFARRCEVNYYTEPLVHVEITITKTYPETTVLPHGQLHVGEIEVKRTVLGYTRKQNHTHTNLGSEDLKEPFSLTLHTQGCWVTIDEPLMEELLGKKYDCLGCLHAVEHAMISFLPLFILGDARDMGGLSLTEHQQTQKATFFLYDGYEGGIGYAQEAFYLFKQLTHATLEGLLHCSCESGCYACIQTPQCGSKNLHLDKAGAIYLLRAFMK